MKGLRNKFIVIGMSLATAIASFASTAGTLAWYAYSTRSTVSFIGTSVRKAELIHIGLVDGEWVVDEDHPDGWDDPSNHYFTDAQLDEFGLKREVTGSKSIVWTSSSTGFPDKAIEAYLKKSPYAYNFLSPVSTHGREKTGSITLYRSPGYGEVTVSEEASRSSYVQLPFAFKSIGNDNQTVKNQKVWMMDAEVFAQTEGKMINESIRVHIKNPTEEFLVNPNIKTGTEGYTIVGGMLDLDGDGTYDVDTTDHNKEYVYGSYTGGSPTYDTNNPYVAPTDPALYTPDNVNNIDLVKYPDLSTFYAKHKDGCVLADTSGITYSQAKYYTLGGIKPTINASGYFDENTGKPVTITDNTYGVGYATITVYLEGWDHSVINAEIGTVFNLGLTFEINKA